jgi:hypothetical protein
LALAEQSVEMDQILFFQQLHQSEEGQAITPAVPVVAVDMHYLEEQELLVKDTQEVMEIPVVILPLAAVVAAQEVLEKLAVLMPLRMVAMAE